MWARRPHSSRRTPHPPRCPQPRARCRRKKRPHPLPPPGLPKSQRRRRAPSHARQSRRHRNLSSIPNPLTPLLFPWRSPRLGGSNSLHPPSQIAWPPKLPEQVALLRKLLATTPPDAASLSAHFGRKNKNRTEQIEGILETLKGLGQL